MSKAAEPLPEANLGSSAVICPPPADSTGVRDLQSLLSELEALRSATAGPPSALSSTLDAQLVQARLGVAASLFAALRCKSPALATHALRVALNVSAWAEKMGMSEENRKELEIAALLHDIGMIGVPERILTKPATLDSEEMAVVYRARRMSLEILRHGCTSNKVLEIVENVSAWYDGSQPGYTFSGERILLEARMIAIVEAFDSMTTEHVYRPARSEEWAITELYACAGKQFDPQLVESFARFCRQERAMRQWETAYHWLRTADVASANACWSFNSLTVSPTEQDATFLFHHRLLENMYDAVIYVDALGKIVFWNRGAERLTGITGHSIRGQSWCPELLELTDERGRAIHDSDCPIGAALRTGAQALRRLTILGRHRRTMVVDVHVIPVVDRQAVTQGVVLLMHDASAEHSLEHRCQSLQEQATKDPLTQAANRAELARMLETFVSLHRQQGVPCSLIMCDLDFFKQINDTYGHQAGDEVIINLASLLKSFCQPGDLVARYGGEEFVVLCADCDNATATCRAEQIRCAFNQLPHEKMDGRSTTASFGVTEIQPGDTPETMLRRADRALMIAKANGRNRVVQLGVGSGRSASLFTAGPQSTAPNRNELLEQELVTSVPLKLAVEKLRGFMLDHKARLISISENRIKLELDYQLSGRSRRASDRVATLWLEAELEEERLTGDPKEGSPQSLSAQTRTRIRVVIIPQGRRERRHPELLEHARGLLLSFRSYLMANAEESPPTTGKLQRIKRLLAPWLLKP